MAGSNGENMPVKNPDAINIMLERGINVEHSKYNCPLYNTVISLLRTCLLSCFCCVQTFVTLWTHQVLLSMESLFMEG